MFSFVSILAEEFLSSKDKYEQEAKDHTAKTAAKSFNDKERVRFPSYSEDSLNSYIERLRPTSCTTMKNK